MPALPLDEAGKYVAGAYGVFVILILVYVAIMASRLQRIERELHELTQLAEQRRCEEALRARLRDLCTRRQRLRRPAGRACATLVAALAATRGRRWNDAALLPGDPRHRRAARRSSSARARSARARSRDC